MYDFDCSCITGRYTADLANAINHCNGEQAYEIIEQLSKLDKSQRVFNVQLDYFGDVYHQEEESIKEEEKNEFR